MKYILIGTHSPEWIAQPEERGKRAHARAAALGLTVESNFYTQGQYDYVTVIEAPNPESVTAFSLWYMQQGFGRVQSMPAFSPTQISDLLGEQKP